MTTEALTEHDIAIMLRRVKRPRDALLIQLGIATGLRIAELLSIKVADIVLRNGTMAERLTVARRHVKGKQQSRSIALSDNTKELLRRYVASTKLSHHDFLFKSCRGKDAISRIQAYRIVKHASLPLSKNIATHSMRKTLAKRVYEKSGKDIALTSKALGHKSVASTMSYLSWYTEKDVDSLFTAF